jgi:Mg2+/Co2+ transporter CorB
MPINLIIISLCVLLIFEIMFYMGDGALLSASTATLYEKYKGSKKIKTIMELKNNANKIGGSIIIITNFSHQLVNRLFTLFAAYYWGSSGEWISTVFLGLFYGYLETFLKFTSVEFAESIVFNFSNFLYFIHKVMAPVSNMIESFVFFQLRLFGIDKQKINDPVHEIRGAIGYNLDKIDDDYAHVLKSAADLINWSVLEIMTHRKNIIMVSVDDSFNNILNSVLSTYQEFIPVWQDDPDNVIGYINSSMFFRSVLVEDYKVNGNKHKKTIKDYIQKPTFIYKRMTISKFLQMLNNKPNIINEYNQTPNVFNGSPALEKVFFVVEEDGSFLGMIHRDNLADAIIRNTNSIDIANIRKYNEGYIVPGGITLNNLNLILDFNLDTSYITLNNLFLNYYNSLNHKNNSITINSYKIILLNKSTSSKMMFYIEKVTGEDNSYNNKN